MANPDQGLEHRFFLNLLRFLVAQQMPMEKLAVLVQ